MTDQIAGLENALLYFPSQYYLYCISMQSHIISALLFSASFYFIVLTITLATLSTLSPTRLLFNGSLA